MLKTGSFLLLLLFFPFLYPAINVSIVPGDAILVANESSTGDLQYNNVLNVNLSDILGKRYDVFIANANGSSDRFELTNSQTGESLRVRYILPNGRFARRPRRILRVNNETQQTRTILLGVLIPNPGISSLNAKGFTHNLAINVVER